MNYITLRKPLWFFLIIMISVSQFILPPINVNAQVRDCAVEWYDTSSIPYIFSHNERNVGLCDRTDAIECGVGGVFAGSINTNDIWCAGGGVPDPPPNNPGVNIGTACQAGTSRTVTIDPTGDTHDLQILPSNQIIDIGGNTSYTFTNLQQGVSYQFSARAENSGGLSDWSVWRVGQQDLSAPTTTLDLVGTAGLNTWWQSAVSVTLPATDSGCLGVSNTLYTLDGVANTYTGSAFNIPNEGTHTLSYYSTDGSYTETAQNATILIDTVVPSLTLSPDRAPDGSAGWWIAPVTVTLSASDSASGVSSLESNLDSAGWTNYINPIALTVDGTYNLDGRAIDVSGWETVDGLVLPLDSTPPVLGFTFSRPPDHNGWYTGAVDVGVTSSDATSGLASTIARIRSEGTWQPYIGLYTLNSDDQHIFEAIATDIASNVTAQEVTIPMDFTAPYLSFVFSREPDRNGWYNSSVHVAIQAGDATSGIAEVQARLAYEGTWRDYQGAYLIGGDGEHIFEAEVTDYAGHLITGQTIVPIDITPPETTLIWDGQTLDFTVSDNRSGVMGTTVTINGVVTRYIGEAIEFEIAGDYRIEVYSTDMAGNDEAVQVLNISYDPDTETALIPLSSPTLSAEITCSAERYDISGFASSSAGLSSIYLLEGDSIVAGGRTDYSPASTDVEAFAFYYVLSEDETPDLSLVALADDGSERRLNVSCPDESILLAPFGFANNEFYKRLLALNPLDDVQDVNTGTSFAETDNNDPSESLNQYPNSLGDISTVLEEVDTNEIQDPAPVPVSAQQQATSNTGSESTNANTGTQITSSTYIPAVDTTVTLLEPSSPDLTYVTGKASTLSAEELAKILAATGLLATATAGVGLQMTETAQRRKEELEAERLAEQARLEKERLAQAERARENVEMNAQMREDAQKEVFIDVQVSEAYKEWEKHVAALWAEYHTRTERGQRINASHAIHDQVQALIDGVDGAISQYGSFMTADELAQLQTQIDTYNASFSDFQPTAMLEQVQGLNELYAPIMTNVQGRYSAWQQAQMVQHGGGGLGLTGEAINIDDVPYPNQSLAMSYAVSNAGGGNKWHEREKFNRWYTHIDDAYGITLDENGNVEWNLVDVYSIGLVAEATARQLGNLYDEAGELPVGVLSLNELIDANEAQGNTITRNQALFQTSMGPIRIVLTDGEASGPGQALMTEDNVITIFGGGGENMPAFGTDIFQYEIAHEFGHVFDNHNANFGSANLDASGIIAGGHAFSYRNADGNWVRNDYDDFVDENDPRSAISDGMPEPQFDGVEANVFEQHPEEIPIQGDDQQSIQTDNPVAEEFADMFAYWVYDGFDKTKPAGLVRQQSMDEWLLGSMIYGDLLTSGENGEPRDSEFVRGVVNQLTQHNNALTITSGLDIAALIAQDVASDSQSLNPFNFLSDTTVENTYTHLDLYADAINNAFDIQFNAGVSGRFNPGDDWNFEGMHFVRIGAERTVNAFGIYGDDKGLLSIELLDDNGEPLLDEDDEPITISITGYDLYRRAFGEMNFQNVDEHSTAFGEYKGGNTIVVYRRIDEEGVETGRQAVMTPNNVIHELGHAFNTFSGLGNQNASGSINAISTRDGLPLDRTGMGYPNPDILTNSELFSDIRTNGVEEPWEGAFLLPQIPGSPYDTSYLNILRQNKSNEDRTETTADAFLNWVWHTNTNGAIGFTTEPVTENEENWETFMNNNMDKWLRNSTLHNAPLEQQLEIFREEGVLPEQGYHVEILFPNYGVRSSPDASNGERLGNLGELVNDSNTVTVYARQTRYNELEEQSYDWYMVVWTNNTGAQDFAWVREDGFNTSDITLEDGSLYESEIEIFNPFDGSISTDNTGWFPSILQGTGQ